MLAHLKKSLASTVNDKYSAPLDVCLIRQCEEKTDDINKELSKARDEVSRMELDNGDKLFEFLDQLENQIFDISISIKKLLSSAFCPSKSPTAPSDNKVLNFLS